MFTKTNEGQRLKGVLEEIAWIVSFNHCKLSIHRGGLSHHFGAYCWPLD